MPTGAMTLDRAQSWVVDYVNPALLRALQSEAGHFPVALGKIVGSAGAEIFARASLKSADFDAIPEKGLRRQFDIGQSAFALTLANMLECANMLPLSAETLEREIESFLRALGA